MRGDGITKCPHSYFDIDLGKAYEYARKSLEAARRSGNLALVGRASVRLGHVHELRDEYDVAVELCKAGIEMAKKTGESFLLGQGYFELSGICQRREDWDRAIECLEHCLKIPDDPDRKYHLWRFVHIYMRKGDTGKAIEYSKEALESIETLGSVVASWFLSVIEESFALAGKREEFISYCRKLMEEKGEALRDLKLKQWYLEPAEISKVFTQATVSQRRETGWSCKPLPEVFYGDQITMLPACFRRYRGILLWKY